MTPIIISMCSLSSARCEGSEFAGLLLTEKSGRFGLRSGGTSGGVLSFDCGLSFDGGLGFECGLAFGRG